MTKKTVGPWKPTIKEWVEAFAYYKQLPGNDEWGSLHIILADGNVTDGAADFCERWALDHQDFEGWVLAIILIQMTKSQRGRLSRKVDEYLQKEKDDQGRKADEGGDLHGSEERG